MSRKALQRLHRRGHKFYFRAVVPKRWRVAVKAFEIKFSLHTEDRTIANIRCRSLSNAFDLFFREENLAQIPLERINEAARTYFQECLNKAFELRFDLPRDGMVDLDFEIEGSRQRIAELRKMLKTLNFDPWIRAAASELLASSNHSDFSLDALSYASTLVAKAQLLQNTFLVEELTGGDYDGAPNDPIFAGILPNKLPEAFGEPVPKAATLAATIETYIALKRDTWVAKTEGDQKRSLYLARDLIGPLRPMKGIGTDDIRLVRDTLMKLPKNALKSKLNEGKSLLEVTQSNAQGERLSFTTQDKYFSMIRSFFKWAVDEEQIPKIPGPNIKIIGALKEAAIDERDPYTPAQLISIFSSPLYSGCKSSARRSTSGHEIIRDGYYWVPIVALYSGMRLGEIVQLRVKDLKIEEEIAYFDVCLDEESDKALKTSSSIRRVPIHPVLISLGLLEHHQKMKKQHKARIFDDIKPSAAGYYSGNFSKWWGRYTRKIGVRTVKTAFHSFRHSFTDALREADVPDDVNRQLDGHVDKDRNKDAHSRYGKKASLKRLYDGITKVNYPEIAELLASSGPTKNVNTSNTCSTG